MDNRTTCAVAACDRKRTCKDWCGTHYGRWKRLGHPGDQPIQSPRSGCMIPGCEARHFGKGYCQTHHHRLRTNGDPLIKGTPGNPPGPEHPHWRGEEVGYFAVHRRLGLFRGRAAEYDCHDCGRQAEDWAYTHDAENELVDPKNGLPYSPDLDSYRPLCRKCHVRFDRG